MQVQPIQPNNPPFGVYKVTKMTSYGKRETGFINGCKLDIYTAKEDGKLVHKLYYLADKAGKWVKSKLVLFANGKKVRVIKNERKKQ